MQLQVPYYNITNDFCFSGLPININNIYENGNNNVGKFRAYWYF